MKVVWNDLTMIDKNREFTDGNENELTMQIMLEPTQLLSQCDYLTVQLLSRRNFSTMQLLNRAITQLRTIPQPTQLILAKNCHHA